MNRGERKSRTAAKLRQRRRMMQQHGQQGGLLYEKHRKKVNKSTGYMRDGNVSHYVAVGFHGKTRDRHRYGAVKILSKRDKGQSLDHSQQLEEYFLEKGKADEQKQKKDADSQIRRNARREESRE